MKRNTVVVQRYAVLRIVSFIVNRNTAAFVQCSVNTGVLPSEAPVIGDTTKETLCVTFKEEKVSEKIQACSQEGKVQN